MPSKTELRRQWNSAGKDVVVLHMLGRGRTSPHVSPFPFKLEAYLKLSGIEYVIDTTQPRSTKGKSPWMTFNGKDMADSQFCINHLAKELDKDISASLTKEERAVERSFQGLLDGILYFCLIMDRWVYNDPVYLLDQVFEPNTFPGPRFLQKLVIKMGQKQVKSQAVGQVRLCGLQTC